MGQGDNIMQKSSGFTLMELLVTIGIIAVVSAIAVPNFMSWMPKYRLGNASRDVLAILQKTRVRAVKDNLLCAVQFNVGNESYTAIEDDGAGTADTTPADGIPDGRGDRIFQATETVIAAKSLLAGIDIVSTTLTGNRVVFDTQGVASNAGSITLRNTRGDSRTIVIEIAGSSRIQ
jgi:prepilin-type N-terminal cleavage/methylation domain-containing protein